MLRRFVAPFGSALTLVGALAIGGAVHQTVVTNNYALTSPVGVLGIGVGIALVGLGYRLEQEFDPSEYVPDEGEEDDEDASEEFDEELSPVSEEMLEDRDADESYDG